MKSQPYKDRFETYGDAEGYLSEFTDYERMLKAVEVPDDLFDLTRIQRLLDRVGNPHHDLHGIHLAGTKGKGSTAVFSETILRAHGFRTGLFTSPHLINKEERIRVCGRLLEKDEFLALMNRLKPSLMELKDTEQPPTFFDILTTVAFLHFRSEQVEAAVMEVGLGGRLDSTNVFRPDACVITRLGMDHMEKLGNTLDRIAAEKAGIIKPSVPVISHPQEPEARSVLEDACREAGSPLFWVGEQIRVEEKEAGIQARFSVQTDLARYPDLKIPVLGRHQRMNAAAAIGAAELFMQAGAGTLPEPDRVREVLAETRLQGRIDMVAVDPYLVVDGAHNPVAVDVLLKTVLEEIRFKDLHVLFACSKDKDVHGMVGRLASAADRWTLTTFDFPRLEDPRRIREILEEQAPDTDARVTRNPDEALEDAYDRSGPGDCILCCGSFYLVGEIFKRIPTFVHTKGGCFNGQASPL